MDILLTEVQSSNVKAIGHDPDTNTLRVQYLNGGIYDFPGVDAECFDRVRNAPSIGRALRSEVHVTGTKVTPQGDQHG